MHEITINGHANPGSGRGRQLGFPTANLTVNSGQKIPQAGVYAAWASIEGQNEWLPAAVHIGPRPTFDDPTPTVEVHLIDFQDQDLYGTNFKVKLIERLRDIKKFRDEEKLTRTLNNDCQQARELLIKNPLLL